MNHLRELLDCLSSGRGLAAHPAFGKAAVDALHVTALKGEEAQCFWLGHDDTSVQSLPNLRASEMPPELTRLPYPTCWFEFGTADKEGRYFVGVLAWETSAGDVQVQGWHRYTANEWRLLYAWTSLSIGLHEPLCTASTLVSDLYSEDQRDSCYMDRVFVSNFLIALSCVNLNRRLTLPDGPLQRKRAKHGKQPLFSFWSLELDGKSQGVESLGGSHSPPRLHLRRGHPREFKPGQWTWVQPHMVGNKQAGMVHKDYAAGKGLGLTDTEQ